MRKRLATMLLVLSGSSWMGTAGAATLTKAPDLGDYWNPLSSWGTYVYADSLIAPVTGIVTDLGAWLRGGSSSLVFEVLADSGNAPNGAEILASTGVLSFNNASLTFEHAAPLSPAALIAGEEYWFAASTVGLGGTGVYDVGGHTQNSGGIFDAGSFWYSNDPVGQSFDGRNLTPEMAFSLTISSLPEPTTFVLFAAGIVALGAARCGKAALR